MRSPGGGGGGEGRGAKADKISVILRPCSLTASMPGIRWRLKLGITEVIRLAKKAMLCRGAVASQLILLAFAAMRTIASSLPADEQGGSSAAAQSRDEVKIAPQSQFLPGLSCYRDVRFTEV